MSNRIDQLEYTVMELGSQLFRMKHELSTLGQSHETFIEVFKNLKAILDDKGVLESEDFDLMTNFHQLLETMNISFEGEIEEPQTTPKSDLH